MTSMVKRVFLVFFLACSGFVTTVQAQDSIPLPVDLSEEKALTFQNFFFKALSEKAIKNYQKAIQYLENCNQIVPNDKAVFFEFSKNYLLLNRPVEAKDYIERALALEPDNVWMLLHLVNVYSQQQDYTNAIATQQQIIAKHPKRKDALVSLLYQNRQYAEALDLLNQMEKEKGLSRNLRQLKATIERRTNPVKKEVITESLSDLVTTFDASPTFTLLKQIVSLAEQQDPTIFIQYSKKGFELFPAQAEAYLLYAKSLLYQKKHQNALTILESGIDFVIDQIALETAFYETMSKAYLGLNQPEKAKEFEKKAKQLKDKL